MQGRNKMKCKLELTNAPHRPFLINWDKFFEVVHKLDLACRESQHLKDCYLANWFRFDQNVLRFKPPVFYLKMGFAGFVDGRHRAVLLSRHKNRFPMVLTQIDSSSQSALDYIVESEMTDEDLFELPDLPVVDKL